MMKFSQSVDNSTRKRYLDSGGSLNHHLDPEKFLRIFINTFTSNIGVVRPAGQMSSRSDLAYLAIANGNGLLWMPIPYFSLYIAKNNYCLVP